MKKSVKKLKLHRETLSQLDAAALVEAAGGVDSIYCLSGPIHKCFLTGGQDTCER